MKKKFYQSEKFQGYFFPILYFIFTVAIIVTSCVIFKNKYYKYILVDGHSMRPTLVGGGSSGQTITKDGQTYSINYRSHYGYASLRPSAVNNLKRFDVCITTYPKSWTTEDDSIIKRVWGFPGETIKLGYANDGNGIKLTFEVSKNNKITRYVAPVVNLTKKYEGEYYIGNKRHVVTFSETYKAAKFDVGHKTFYTNFSTSACYRTINSYTLGKSEYFVMGDNWELSTDSYKYYKTSSDKLTKNYLRGKVACIDAYATAKGSEAMAIHKIKPKMDF